MFRDVDHALSVAYAREAQIPIKISSAFSQMRGGSVRGPNEMNTLDWIIQGVFLQALVRRVLFDAELYAVEGFYTIPCDQAMRDRKQFALALLAQAIVVRARRPQFFVLDTIRGWSRGIRAHHDAPWWANHLGVTRRTIHRWQYEPMGHANPGICRIAEHWLQVAGYRLEPLLIESGLITPI